MGLFDARRPTAGRLPLHLGIDSGHSTLSDDWRAKAPTQDRWSDSTVTVAELAARHGDPAFMKIDMEGYEAEVILGCAQLPPALSFEYQCSDLSVTDDCLKQLDGYEFNQVPSNETQFVDRWCSAAELQARLGAYDAAEYGDAYARR